MIYTTFEQWADGNFLETGEPRKQAYSKDELALIEMGWGYGYDAGVESEREACAKICEDFADTDSYGGGITTDYHAILIRARGQA